ncbi:helix-turn-helix domain-containing protein [Geobacillus subterraneus]|uniref:helix-turn-helix domain-containing protein n=1 Tax=Geobacillus subterraneus TaxID=129338 RepID=UPI00161CE18D
MLTSFGRFCRKLRIDHGELLKHMADKLGVTSSYLSAVENGKRNVPQGWIEKISDLYSLNVEEQEKLKQAVFESQKIVKLDFEDLNADDKTTILALARQFKELDKKDKETIKAILLKNRKKGE